MADTRPLLPSDPNALPTAYTPLPGGSSPGIQRIHVKEVLALFAGVVMVSLLVVIIGNTAKEANEYHGNSRSDKPMLLAASPSKEPATKTEKLKAVTRGLTAGVSEKSRPVVQRRCRRGHAGVFVEQYSLSEHTPVFFYVAKGSGGTVNTYFCADQTRSSVANDVVKPVAGSYVPVLKDEKLSVRILIWQMNSAFIRPFSPDEASHASFTPVTIFIKFIVPLGIFLTLYFVR
ncbi:hypothetical protein M0R45_024679 [Rubus argutus]|uniref:beta-fructofuranosidase n=1 Tax=Rubus argutus TaxID=59490 RepID=A0AAW1WTE2_RUBAR